MDGRMNSLIWNQVRCAMCGNVFNAHSCPVCGCPLAEMNDDRKDRPGYDLAKGAVAPPSPESNAQDQP